jgi:hypothetical protein
LVIGFVAEHFIHLRTAKLPNAAGNQQNLPRLSGV